MQSGSRNIQNKYSLDDPFFSNVSFFLGSRFCPFGDPNVLLVIPRSKNSLRIYPQKKNSTKITKTTPYEDEKKKYMYVAIHIFSIKHKTKNKP